MRPRLAWWALCLAGCGGPVDAPPPWRLIWGDEFTGPAGAAPDEARWSAEVGGDGWGNQELQFYTEAPANAALDGAGHLLITARREARGGRAFTSARLTTRGKFEPRYGRIEARLRLPRGQGLWPAFWLLGVDGDGLGWPARGEIDVIEARGALPTRVSSAVHGPGYSGGNAVIAGYQTPDRADLTADFHRYAVEWSPEELRFFVDDEAYHLVRATRLPGGATWVFDRPFFLILNLAVGGTFGGPPTEATPLPQALTADYVRVYQR